TLVTGPTREIAPAAVRIVEVESAWEMLAAVEAALPADVAIFAAAVADWRAADASDRKIKKDGSGVIPDLKLAENPDILATIAQRAVGDRPPLVVGFAAETDDVIANAIAKRKRKGCDWIVANDVSGDVMGGGRNAVTIIDERGEEAWPEADKTEVARRLAHRIADWLARETASC
ncbi:MAG: phosphopantothenoylcysteine decarboxylase, partial [Pseudomonadota bacterium]